MKKRKLLPLFLALGLALSACSQEDSGADSSPNATESSTNSTETSTNSTETSTNSTETNESSSELENNLEEGTSAEEISISGKILSISNVLAVEDENGELHTIANDSGETWEGVTLGGLVNLTYSGDTVTEIQQTAQAADVVGAYVNSHYYYTHSYYAEPFGEWVDSDPSTIEFYDFSEITNLSEAEKEVLLLRIQSAFAEKVEHRFGTWEDVGVYAAELGIPKSVSELGFPYYDGINWRTIFTIDDSTEGKLVIGNATNGGMTEYTTILDSTTGTYSIQVTGGAG